MEFKHGAKYLRADFHLHTKADKWFKFDGEENDFVKDYVRKLKDENIQLGVITNHNKFDKEQYKALRKKAKQEGIYLLPGIELNVNEGSSGLHSLIVFDNETWLQGENDFINDFIVRTTPTDNQDFKYNNGRSQHNLIQTIELLNSYHKSYFIILAHVSSDNGLIKELNGQAIKIFGKNPLFKNYVIGFQSIKERDKAKVEQCLSYLPALVEGSDPKNIEEIGKGEKCYLKLSDFNFDAVKFALIDNKNRLCKDIPKQQNTYIKSIKYIGGKLNEKEIYLNASMNNLIGIRGSGKSSVLETIRYALDIELDRNISADENYKNSLILSTLGGGGKVIFEIVKNDNIFCMEKGTTGRTKCLENKELRVKSLLKTFYFGQKDLSKIGENKETNKDFVYRLIGEIDTEQKIISNGLSIKIHQLLEDISQLNKKIERIPDIKTRIAELTHSISDIEKLGLKEKMEKEINFGKDADKIRFLKNEIQQTIQQFNNFVSSQNTDFDYIKIYNSKENTNLFNELYLILDSISAIQKSFAKHATQLQEKMIEIETIENKFIELKQNLETEFAQSQRESKISANDIKNYQDFQTELNSKKLQLIELEKLISKKDDSIKKLQVLLSELQNSWKNEYDLIQNKVHNVNAQQDKLKIILGFEKDKEALIDFVFKQSHNIRRENIKSIVNKYHNLIDVYLAFENNSIEKFNQIEDFKTQFFKNLSDFITYRVPDTFEIEYNGKPLKNHSLGQRASALIVFLLSLQENDLILIDQPEDDLDSQTIYNEVIVELKKLKNSTQFIFATHNPNIPVLGDCEQVLVCDYDNVNEKINIFANGIDNKDIQKSIVNIMEGGEKAFEERKIKYSQWKH